MKDVIQRALTKPHILEQTSKCSWGAVTDSPIDIIRGPFGDEEDDYNRATQEATQEAAQESTQQTLPTLAGDVRDNDGFLSAPSSPTLPRSKSRYHDI
ncbi:hypothetical protein ACHAQJ_004155 [Trichoderma viride]